MIRSGNVCLCCFLLLISLSQIACKSGKTAGTARSVKTGEDIYENFVSNIMDISSFEATATIITSGDPGSHRFKCILRMVEDSIIWGSLQKFGFEFARIRITPERFQMLNRIERSFVDEDISKVSELIGINLEFGQFWNLLRGVPLYSPAEGYQANELEFHHDISFRKALSSNQLMITKSDGQLESYFLRQEINPDITALLHQNYKDYKTITNNKYFSYIRILEVKVPAIFEGAFQINFDQINPNAKFSTGFEIPSGYSRSEI